MSTAAGEGILRWLDTAITHREAIAGSAAHAVGGPSWDGSERDVSARKSGETVADGVTYGDLWEPMQQEACDHIALNDPESVLRRCAADRKTIDFYRTMLLMDVTHCLPVMNSVLKIMAEGYGWTGGDR